MFVITSLHYYPIINVILAVKKSNSQLVGQLVFIACLSPRTFLIKQLVMNENKLVPVWVPTVIKNPQKNLLITKNENAGLWCRLGKKTKCATVYDQLCNFIMYRHCQNDGERLWKTNISYNARRYSTEKFKCTIFSFWGNKLQDQTPESDAD